MTALVKGSRQRADPGLVPTGTNQEGKVCTGRPRPMKQRDPGSAHEAEPQTETHTPNLLAMSRKRGRRGTEETGGTYVALGHA